jgi:cell division protein FtsB
VEGFPPNCAKNPSVGAATVRCMKDTERDEAVRDHLTALDEEIARLRQMEAALDRRIAEADDERQAIEDATRDQSGQ